MAPAVSAVFFMKLRRVMGFTAGMAGSGLSEEFIVAFGFLIKQ